MKWYMSVILFCLTLWGCSSSKEQDDTKSPEQFAAELEGLPIDEFFAISFAELLLRDPEAILEQGRGDEVGLTEPVVTDISIAYRNVTREYYQVVLAQLAQYEQQVLTTEHATNLAVYRWYLQDQLSLMGFGDFRLTALKALSLDRLFWGLHPLEGLEDAQNYLAQLSLLPRQYNLLQAHLGQRRDKGIVDTQRLLDNVAGQLQERLQLGLTQDPIYLYFEEALLAAGAPTSDRTEMLAQLSQVLQDVVRPAQAELSQFIAMLQQQAPSQIGLAQYPDGLSYYQAILAHHLTTEVDVNRLMQLGMEELTRVQHEIESEFERLGYPQDLSLLDAYAMLEQSAAQIEADSIVAEFEALVQDAEVKLNDAFYANNLSLPEVTASYQDGYFPAAIDGSAPARFVVDTRLSRPFYQMPSLAYHEGVPGHHLQIATTQTLTLPLIRTQPAITVYNEGWGLYVERLAAELGWLDEYDYAHLGQLQWEALRAARLVADIGVNAKGWSWDEASAFLIDNSGFSEADVSGYVARFVVNPGQAAAYTFGLLELLAIRSEVQSQQGAEFELKDFHQAVLQAGPLPMPLLRQVITAERQD